MGGDLDSVLLYVSLSGNLAVLGRTCVGILLVELGLLFELNQAWLFGSSSTTAVGFLDDDDDFHSWDYATGAHLRFYDGASAH